MMFPPFLMARIGQAVSDTSNEDHIRQQENQVKEWEAYARSLERELDTVRDNCRELAAQALQLIQFAKAIEQERNELVEKRESLEQENRRLHYGITDLRKMRDESDTMRKEIETLRSEASKLEYGYGTMKTILTKMSHNADRVFTAEVTAKQREQLAKLLELLP